MVLRYFVLILGIMFVAIGVLGFVPALVVRHEPMPDLAVHAYHGYLFGLFPVNVLHNGVHVITGLLGIMAYFRLEWARLFARGLAIFYGLLMVMGFFPYLNTTFGMIPIHGHDIWLHGLIAAAAAYFGFFAEADTGAPRRARAA